MKTVGIFLHYIFMPVSIIAQWRSIDQQIMQYVSVQNTHFFDVSTAGSFIITAELDVMMTVDRFKALHAKNQTPRGKRKSRANRSTLWPRGVVNYQIDKELHRVRYTIYHAIEHWVEYTCIQFVNNATADTVLWFKWGYGCKSYIGKTFGEQELFLHEDCISFPTVVHEIGHAIGFYHEHMRPDRDKYIDINFRRIPPTYHAEFQKITTDIYTYNIPYDYTSIMHFGSFGGITTRDPSYQERIGQSSGLSFKDIKSANRRYSCWYQKCEITDCPFNGFALVKPLKGQPKCSCWCNSGQSWDPLVLCSSIDKEFPEPNIASASTLNLTDESDCIDMRDNCTYWKEQGMCRTEIIMMNKMCAKTCNFCGKAKHLCMDNDSGCGMMASTGACNESGLYETMSKLCPKSCGFCITISSPCDIERSLMEPFKLNGCKTPKRNRWIMFIFLFVAALSFCI